MTQLSLTHRGWTRAERSRLAGVVSAIAALHIAGWTLYFWQANDFGAAGGFAGAGILAYVLGIRHAFDADHTAAIDDTTRLLMLRGKRPVGVGFFFALGHSAVVLLLASSLRWLQRICPRADSGAFARWAARWLWWSPSPSSPSWLS